MFSLFLSCHHQSEPIWIRTVQKCLKPFFFSFSFWKKTSFRLVEFILPIKTIQNHPNDKWISDLSSWEIKRGRYWQKSKQFRMNGFWVLMPLNHFLNTKIVHTQYTWWFKEEKIDKYHLVDTNTDVWSYDCGTAVWKCYSSWFYFGTLFMYIEYCVFPHENKKKAAQFIKWIRTMTKLIAK